MIDMMLLTKALEARFKKVGRQEEVEDPIVLAKFFYPASAATWWATEYHPEDREFFGYVTLYGLGDSCNEWGSFSLDELQGTKVRGLCVERDLYWEEQPMSKACPEAMAALGR